MPRTPEQYSQIREIKRRQIMDSALEIFAEKGFSAASMSMIATKAGTSKGLTYNYFKSKDDLITSIINDGFDRLLEVLQPNSEGVFTKKELVIYIDKTFQIIQSNIHFWKLYFLVIMQPDVIKLIEAKLMEVLIPFLTCIESYYKEQGVENPMAYARFIGATLDGIFLNYVVDPEGFPINDVKNIIINKIL